MATIYSGNGWIARGDTSKFVRATAAGFGFWAANADVAVVFKEFIERFDREVEELTQPLLDDWSYANRLVRGSTSVVSNHGSATAIDLNAVKHGRGRRDTFTPAKQAAMRRIRDSITDNSGQPVLRLGMEYTKVPDDMHVEINTNAARVKQAADKIRKKNAPKPPSKPAVVEDIVASKAELKALLIDIIENHPFVKNLPTVEGGPVGAEMSLATVLAYSDLKADRANDKMNTVASAVSTQAADLKRAEGKVDALGAQVKVLSEQFKLLLELLDKPEVTPPTLPKTP